MSGCAMGGGFALLLCAVVVLALPAAATATAATGATVAASPTGRLTLPDFNSLGPRASDSVSIALDASLLGVAARFLDGEDPDERALQELIRGLQGIYVKSYTFDRDFAYPTAEVASVRQQLAAPEWQRIVQVHDGKQQTAVDIYLCQVRDRTLGLAIIATEPRQFTIVNIVGMIDLAKLHRLEGRFGIPKLDHGDGGRG
jgi:hypothetical protein